MATSSGFLSEKQLECPICFDLYNNPVSLPCGHFFCDAGIQQHWRGKALHQCPLCKQEFDRSLKLCVNILFRDIVEKYKEEHVLADNDEPTSPDHVPCDCCLHTKRRAAKTCLVCLTSYCETHLEPHLRVATLKTHKLSDPVSKLEEKICVKHNRLLEENSDSDRTHVCALCVYQTQYILEKKGSDAKTQTEDQHEEIHYIKLNNPGKKHSRVAQKTADTELTDDNIVTEDFENVHIWLNDRLYTFSPLPLDCGFSSGRVYFDVPITENGEWDLGVVNERLRGNRVFSTDSFGSWVVKYNPTLCATAGCASCKNKYPDRVFLCVDYKKGTMLLVHPCNKNVLSSFTDFRFRGKLFVLE